jgi:hypothetical protein
MSLKSLLRQVKASGKIWTHHNFSWINAIIQNEFILWKTTRYFKIKTGLRVEACGTPEFMEPSLYRK